MGVARGSFPYATVADAPEHIPRDARARLHLGACLRGRAVVDVARLYLDSDGEFVVSVDRDLSDGAQAVLFRSAEDGQMGDTATAFIEVEAAEEWRLTPVEGQA